MVRDPDYERVLVKRFNREGFGMDWDGTGYVRCDKLCMALEEPEDYEEAMRTLEHYKNHSYLGGCSHGS
jgi:hypothetical protein